MKQVGYYNGEIGPLEAMKVPMLDRALYFGDGCYDAATFKNHRIFALDDHLDRFYNSCRMLQIEFPLDREALAAELQKVVDLTDAPDGFLYWQASRGTAPRAHEFPNPKTVPNLMIYSKELHLKPMDTTLDLISTEDIRYEICNIKTLNLLPNVLAFQKAIEAGCQEVVMHRGEIVTECAHSNVLIIKNGVLKSHPRDNHILPGISLKHLFEIAPTVGIPAVEEAFTMDELRDADEVLVSSTSKLCLRAVSLDGKPVGGKDPETAKKLQQAYWDYYEKDVS